MSHGAMTQERAQEYSYKLSEALYNVEGEMLRQITKWGLQDHHSYLNNDVIEVLERNANLDIEQTLTDFAKKVCDKRLGMGVCSWQDILNEEVFEARDEAIAGNTEALKTELVQIAAVALSWYLSVERNGR